MWFRTSKFWVRWRSLVAYLLVGWTDEKSVLVVWTVISIGGLWPSDQVDCVHFENAILLPYKLSVLIYFRVHFWNNVICWCICCVSLCFRCSLTYIDFEGRSDGESIKRILSLVNPRKLVRVCFHLIMKPAVFRLLFRNYLNYVYNREDRIITSSWSFLYV